jgi:hypothetical protein
VADPIFPTVSSQMAVRLLALRVGLALLTEISCYSFLLSMGKPQGHGMDGTIQRVNDFIGTRIRYFPTCRKFSTEIMCSREYGPLANLRPWGPRQLSGEFPDYGETEVGGSDKALQGVGGN